MFSDFWNLVLGVVLSSGLISAVAYLMRDTIGRVFTKAVEHRFERKLESFKSEVRDNEKELDQIRSFLVSARRDRDSAVQLKQQEAAEILLRARQSLSQLSMLVEYMKILNTDQLLKDGDDPKVVDLIETLTKPFNIDAKIEQFGTIDKTIPRLYLSDKTLKAFDAYESIILHAVMMLKFLVIPLRNKGRFLKAGSLIKEIIELIPHAKEGFDKWGEEYAYYWSNYFHDEILRSLRYELSGADDETRDARSVERLALESRRAQISVRSTLEKVGLPENLINNEDNLAETFSAAEKASH